ncbi:MAG: single-stranded DNA-binding protein [Bacteroidales bacterium]|nr:single-stranded DNA-binding protein [Bacteroidales bacterium]
MEQLNRIELRGVIGTIKTQVISGSKMSRFSVATSRAYKDKEGVAQIDTTWHNVVAWENDKIQDLDKLKTGSKVYVSGRLQTKKFTGQDGVERISFEVVALKVLLIESEEPLQYEF